MEKNNDYPPGPRRSAELRMVPEDKAIEFGEFCLNLSKKEKKYIREFFAKVGRLPDARDIFNYWSIKA